MARRRSQPCEEAEMKRYREEAARKNIEKYREILRLDYTGIKRKPYGLYKASIYFDALAESYRTLGDIENVKWCAHQIIDIVQKKSQNLREMVDEKEQRITIQHYQNAHFLLAPYEFEMFLKCLEVAVPEDGKFYASRSNIIRKDVLLLQDLEEGKLKGLSISAPPRTYKTALGIRFLTWCALRHPEESCMFVSHTNKMCRDVFRKVLDMLNSAEVQRIFPGMTINQSAEDLWIDIYPKSSENGYHSIYFAGIDSNMAGVINCSWLLYCDDLLTEQDARNPDLVEASWDKYATGILQRVSSRNYRELNIATRWSTKDVVTTLENKKQNDPTWKFVKRPAQDPITRESNFLFRKNPLTKEHFEEIRQYMNDIDYECIYQQNPMDKQGLLFPENELQTFKELPNQPPDEIFGACDVAFSGADHLSLPIVYRYGDEFYIADVVFDSRGYTQTEPVVANFIIQHHPNRIQFEANNGGEFYANDIKNMIKGKSVCRIDTKRTPSSIGKGARIEQFEPIIKKFKFLDKKLYKFDSPYGLFIKELCSYNMNGKNKHDDAPDSLAMAASMIRTNNSGKVAFFNRRDFGL